MNKINNKKTCELLYKYLQLNDLIDIIEKNSFTVITCSDVYSRTFSNGDGVEAIETHIFFNNIYHHQEITIAINKSNNYRDWFGKIIEFSTFNDEEIPPYLIEIPSVLAHLLQYTSFFEMVLKYAGITVDKLLEQEEIINLKSIIRSNNFELDRLYDEIYRVSLIKKYNELESETNKLQERVKELQEEKMKQL